MDIILSVVFIIVFALLIAAIVNVPISNSSVKTSSDDSEVSRLTVTADYVGGIANILEKTRCTLILMRDKINFRIDFKDTDLFIAFDQLVDLKLQNAKELFESFESSAYVSKKDKVNPQLEFLVITYRDSMSETERKLLINCKSSKLFLDKYYETFAFWYNEKNAGSACSFDHKSNSLICSA